jgi:hypothetical protein
MANVNFFTSGDPTSETVAYYFGGLRNQISGDSPSTTRNVLRAMPADTFNIAIKISYHENGDAYRSDSNLVAFYNSFRSISEDTTQIINKLNSLEEELVNQTLTAAGGTPGSLPRNRRRIFCFYSAGNNVFNRLFDLGFFTDIAITEGIVHLDDLYSSRSNEKILQLANNADAGIRQSVVNELSGNRNRNQTSQIQSATSVFFTQTETSHENIPSEFIAGEITRLTS